MKYIFNITFSMTSYPVIYFNCLLEFSDKKSLYKKLKIDIKTQNEPFNLKVMGNLIFLFIILR